MQTVEQSVLPLRPRLLDQVRYAVRTEEAALGCHADIAILVEDDRSWPIRDDHAPLTGHDPSR